MKNLFNIKALCLSTSMLLLASAAHAGQDRVTGGGQALFNGIFKDNAFTVAAVENKPGEVFNASGHLTNTYELDQGVIEAIRMDVKCIKVDGDTAILGLKIPETAKVGAGLVIAAGLKDTPEQDSYAGFYIEPYTMEEFCEILQTLDPQSEGIQDLFVSPFTNGNVTVVDGDE